MNTKFCVDANVFITPWNTDYPMDIFPSLWEALAQHKENIVLIKPIYDEIDPLTTGKRGKLRQWLLKNKFMPIPVDENIQDISIKFENEYQINEKSRGVGKNDLMLIAYAHKEEGTVVTFETKQAQAPDKKKNYKIPLVCKEKDTACITFVEMLRKLGIQV